MIIIPAGRFRIGSPDDESGRGSDEGPQLLVSFDGPFAISRFEITRGEYSRFVRALHYPVSGNCITDRRKRGVWQPDADTNYRDPGFDQTDDHPVACVSWNDANAYVAWLNAKTGGGYRLLSEAEWEYAARAGSTTAYPWGANAADGCRFMNGTDLTARRKYVELDYVKSFGTCDDHALNTAPVGSYRANAFGLFDMLGNVGEWTQACASKSYADEPKTASTVTPGCSRRVVRGGSWGTVARQLRSAERVSQPPTDRDDSIGIRVAKDIY